MIGQMFQKRVGITVDPMDESDVDISGCGESSKQEDSTSAPSAATDHRGSSAAGPSQKFVSVFDGQTTSFSGAQTVSFSDIRTGTMSLLETVAIAVLADSGNAAMANGSLSFFGSL